MKEEYATAITYNSSNHLYTHETGNGNILHSVPMDR